MSDAPDPPLYQALMRIKPADLTLNAWTVKAKVSRPFFNDVRKHGNPKRQTLEKVLTAIGWTFDRFESETGLYPVRTEVLDYLRRPAALADDDDSYALGIVGSSMKPRFKPGERVGVSPRASIDIGDDVIVQLRGENTNRVKRVLIKELVRRTATYVILRQYNPERELRIERSAILAMHKVKGHFL